MSLPTVGIGFSPTIPAADSGFQNAKPRGDNGTPLEKFSFEVPGTGIASVKTANYTAVAGDCGKHLSFADSSPATAHTLTLPSSAPFAQWQISVQNTGTSTLTIDRNGKTIDGGTTNPTLAQGSGMVIYTDGTNYFTERGATPASPLTSTVGITIDGGGSAPSIGLKGMIQVPFAGTIVGWSALADVAGILSMDIWKVASSAPPSVPIVPTSGNKISASAPIVLSTASPVTAAQSASSGTSGVSTWTTAVAAYDVFAFNLASASTLTRVTIELHILRS